MIKCYPMSKTIKSKNCCGPWVRSNAKAAGVEYKRQCGRKILFVEREWKFSDIVMGVRPVNSWNVVDSKTAPSNNFRDAKQEAMRWFINKSK